MTCQIVEENSEAAAGALRTYAVFVLVPATLIRLLTQRYGFLESVCLCGFAQILVVYCHYYVGSENEHFRRRFRLLLSALTAIGCAILLSHGGLGIRSLDWRTGLVFGGLCGVATHLIGMIVGAIADLVLDRVRRFVNPHECLACGYDLTGNRSGICPECGDSIPLLRRGQTSLTSERSTSKQ